MTVIYNYLKRQLGLFKIKIVTNNKRNKLNRTSKFISYPNFNPEQYRNKIILAPMVRVGTLPIRILSLRYGADLVYTEELIDWELASTTRIVNDGMKTVDFIDNSDGTVLFRTCDEEKSRVIVQIGTSCPDRALKCAKLVENDVAGIDVNMGCPKDYAIKGGTGAVLMSQPEKIRDILTNLVSNTKIPVTCKVRVFPSLDDTLKLCEMIQSCGVSALAVHGRTKEADKEGPNQNDYIKAIAKSLTIPVIANGNSKFIKTYEDIQQFKVDTECSSVMIARAAQWNPSVFRISGKIRSQELIAQYLKLCVDFDNYVPNTKFNIQNLIRKKKFDKADKMKIFEAALMPELCELFGVKEYLNEVTTKRKEEQERKSQIELNRDFPEISMNNVTILDDFKYRSQSYRDEPDMLPKCVLDRYLQNIYKQNEGIGKAPRPIYKVKQRQRRTRALITIDNGATWYGNAQWYKNRKRAEQSAALALIRSMKISG